MKKRIVMFLAAAMAAFGAWAETETVGAYRINGSLAKVADGAEQGEIMI